MGFNQDLEPEDLTSWEIGVRGLAAPARLRYEVAFYTSKVANGLIPFERPDGVVFFTNAGETSRKRCRALSRVGTRFELQRSLQLHLSGLYVRRVHPRRRRLRRQHGTWSVPRIRYSPA